MNALVSTIDIRPHIIRYEWKANQFQANELPYELKAVIKKPSF